MVKEVQGLEIGNRSTAGQHNAVIARLLVPIIALLLVWPSHVRSSSDDAYSWPPRQAFYAGTFFDVAESAGTSLENYLVRPVTGDSRTFNGNELSGVVRAFLKSQPHLTRNINLAVSNSTKGNPVAFFVSRAYHQQHVMTPEGRRIYFTWPSITVHMDVFTDEAAFENVRRFETLYSDLQIRTQPIKTMKPLSSTKLQQEYTELLHQAVGALLERAAQGPTWRRGFTEALFKVEKFYPPKQMSSEYKLVAYGGDQHSSRTRSANTFGREVLFQLNAQLNNVLRKEGLTQIGIIPPDSPWTKGKIIRLLERRPGLGFLNSTGLSTPDLHALGARKLLVAWAGDELRREKVDRVREIGLFKSMLAAAIYDVETGGKLGGKQPDCLPDSKLKTLGHATFQFRDVQGLPPNRRVFTKGVRLASQDLAAKLVGYMKLIAQRESGADSSCSVDPPVKPQYSSPKPIEDVVYEDERG